MRFELSEDQELLRSSTRDFLESELPIEKTRRTAENDPRGLDREAWRRLAEMGYLGLVLPETAGGQGLGAIELAIVAEELGRTPVPGPFLDATLAASVLAAVGSVREAASIAAGERIVGVAREDSPFRGRVPDRVRFRDGRVVGRKHLVSFAGEADALLVTTDDGIALVEEPFRLEPTPTLDPFERLATVELDQPGTIVAPLDALAAPDRVLSVAAAATLLGLASAAFERTLAYAKTRHTFGRPIGSFQALQHRLADGLLRLESTRSIVYRAAWCLANGDPEAPLAAAAAKAYAGDAARAVCGEAIQMHGGIGFTWELDLHLFLKRTKTLEQRFGSTEESLERVLPLALA